MLFSEVHLCFWGVCILLFMLFEKFKYAPFIPPEILPLVFATLIAISIRSAASAQRSQYGEACNATLRCDRRSWLGCFEGACGCLQPDDMTFDPVGNKCVAKAGERCRYALDAEMTTTRYEVTDCIKDSFCGSDGFCTCSPGYFEVANGTCVNAKSHGESCDEKTKCSTAAGLHCVNETCQCQSDLSAYSDSRGMCVGLAEKTCINNACVDGARCYKSKCQCNTGFYLDVDLRCIRKRGIFENCTSEDQCEQQPGLPLGCFDGVCSCDPEISIYGTTYRRVSNNYGNYRDEPVIGCLGKIHQTCNDGLCVPGSECRSNICHCQSGYTAKRSMAACGRSYGDSCQRNLDIECIDGLTCLNGKCHCPYGEYNSGDRSCYSRVGGPCNDNLLCYMNSFCEVDPLTYAKHCRCKVGYIENAEAKCDIAYGEICNNTTPCDPIAGLACKNGTCQCPGFQKYQADRLCAGLVGADCDEVLSNCVENASCQVERRGMRPKCVCTKQGYIETADYLCKPLEEDLPTLPKF